MSTDQKLNLLAASLNSIALAALDAKNEVLIGGVSSHNVTFLSDSFADVQELLKEALDTFNELALQGE